MYENQIRTTISIFFVHLITILIYKCRSEIVISISGAVTLVGGVILYAVISTATGLEEDENQNYIPDWIEKKFPSIFKSSKDLD